MEGMKIVCDSLNPHPGVGIRRRSGGRISAVSRLESAVISYISPIAYMGFPSIISGYQNRCRRVAIIKSLNRIGVNIHITAGSARFGRSGTPVSLLSRGAFAFVQRFTRHDADTRPPAGKTLEVDAALEVTIAGALDPQR